MGVQNRTEGYPSLTAREHWGKYAAGIVTEAAYVGTLMLIGLVLAVIAMAVWA